MTFMELHKSGIIETQFSYFIFNTSLWIFFDKLTKLKNIFDHWKTFHKL